MKKLYVKIGSMLEEIQTESATEAMKWHRSGDDIDVMIQHDNGTRQHLAYIPGATQKKLDENWEHCRRIANVLEAYADNNIMRCPCCGEDHEIPVGIGDKYKCPSCGTVSDFDDFEILGIWDYLSDVYDIEYRVDSSREYRSVRIMVACGGPNIYINTASGDVELYWWTESARYAMSRSAIDAVDEWAADIWETGN